MGFSDYVLKLREGGKPEVTLCLPAAVTRKCIFKGQIGDNWRYKSRLERQEISIGNPEF